MNKIYIQNKYINITYIFNVIYTYIYIYIYIYTNIHTYTYIYIYIYMMYGSMGKVCTKHRFLLKTVD